jgi:hypothetical protein
MNQSLDNKLLIRIRVYVSMVIIGLFLSGVTAFPIETELGLLVDNFASGDSKISSWLGLAYLAVGMTNTQFPFLSYGTDWLAFAHIMFAVLFFGPLLNPVKNIWVVEFGMIAAVCIFPLAFCAGTVRGIPLFWTMIDCSFGVVTILLLIPCYRDIKKLEKLT